jgi:hypothetical protein
MRQTDLERLADLGPKHIPTPDLKAIRLVAAKAPPG